MNDVLSAVLQLLVLAGIPAAVAYLLVPGLVARAVPEVLAALAHTTPEETHVAHTGELIEDDPLEPDETPRRRTPWALICTLMGLVIIVMAIQVLLSNEQKQTADEDRDAVSGCLVEYAGQTEQWARDVNDVLNAGRDATRTLRKATAEWTRANDAILQLLFRSNSGEELPEAEVNATIKEYQLRKDALFQAYADAEQTTVENPYPELVLDCKDSQVDDDITNPPTTPPAAGNTEEE